MKNHTFYIKFDKKLYKIKFSCEAQILCKIFELQEFSKNAENMLFSLFFTICHSHLRSGLKWLTKAAYSPK